MVITGYGLLWYFFTLAAGASFMYIWIQFKTIRDALAEFDEDDLEDDDYTIVTVAGKYYEVPKAVGEAIANMNKCAELLATDLAKAKKKDAAELFLNYFNKAKETTKN